MLPARGDFRPSADERFTALEPAQAALFFTTDGSKLSLSLLTPRVLLQLTHHHSSNHLKCLSSRMDLKQAFDHFDKDGSGKLNAEEFRHVLQDSKW